MDYFSVSNNNNNNKCQINDLYSASVFWSIIYFSATCSNRKGYPFVKCHVACKLQFLSDKRSNLKVSTVTCDAASISSEEVNINN
jgi:hypothetical protein